MIDDEVFYTKTIAKVFAAQGNLEKAAEIYKYLLKREPQRHDLIDALSEIEKKRSQTGLGELEEMMGKWVDLLIKYNGIRKLKKLQRLLNERS